jgi:hypothetical protein
MEESKSFTVFISFSKSPAKEIAGEVKILLQNMFPSGYEFFVSDTDIAPGDRKNETVDKKLEDSNFGILILTSNNYAQENLMFEAGSLTKDKQAKLALCLFDRDTKDIESPLQAFYYAKFDKDDYKKLVVNLKKTKRGLEELDPREQENLDVLLTYHWGDFRNKVESIIKQNKGIQKVKEEEYKNKYGLGEIEFYWGGNRKSANKKIIEYLKDSDLSKIFISAIGFGTISNVLENKEVKEKIKNIILEDEKIEEKIKNIILEDEKIEEKIKNIISGNEENEEKIKNIILENEEKIKNIILENEDKKEKIKKIEDIILEYKFKITFVLPGNVRDLLNFRQEMDENKLIGSYQTGQQLLMKFRKNLADSCFSTETETETETEIDKEKLEKIEKYIEIKQYAGSVPRHFILYGSDGTIFFGSYLGHTTGRRSYMMKLTYKAEDTDEKENEKLNKGLFALFEDEIGYLISNSKKTTL